MFGFEERAGYSALETSYCYASISLGRSQQKFLMGILLVSLKRTQTSHFYGAESAKRASSTINKQRNFWLIWLR